MPIINVSPVQIVQIDKDGKIKLIQTPAVPVKTPEPVAEEPVAKEEPVAEEPVAEEPVAEEPVAEKPAVKSSKKKNAILGRLLYSIYLKILTVKKK